MAMRSHSTVVGVFSDHQQAQRAVSELRRLGFSEDQIGVARRGSDDDRGTLSETADAGDETYAGEGTAAGLATGAGVGALWGLGIIAGVLPAVGPAIAGGTLAAILSSAAAGAVTAGLGGALIGLGLSKDEAEYYDSEFASGRTVVTVTAAGREEEAESVLRQYGGYNISHKGVTADTMGTSSMRTSSMGSAAANTTGCETGVSREMRGEGSERMTAYEEELSIEKHPVERDVNIRKEVHTEHKTIDVPVQREEVVIERRAPSSDAAGSIEGHQEIRIPIREEQISVEKVAVPKEDVVIGKRQVQGTERVQETLRKEEIKIENEENADVRDRRRNT